MQTVAFYEGVHRASLSHRHARRSGVRRWHHLPRSGESRMWFSSRNPVAVPQQLARVVKLILDMSILEQIVAEGARNNHWRIQLDEGTVFTTVLPDPDVQIREPTMTTRHAFLTNIFVHFRMMPAHVTIIVLIPMQMLLLDTQSWRPLHLSRTGGSCRTFL
jgi:hypothetical protein